MGTEKFFDFPKVTQLTEFLRAKGISAHITWLKKKIKLLLLGKTDFS